MIKARGLSQAKLRGFTLIEMVVYIAIIAVVFALVLTGMISLYRASTTARESREQNLAATIALERMSREIRDAKSILVASSTFSTTPGKLVIKTDNASTTGGYYTFNLATSSVFITANAASSTLTGSEARVTELRFWRIVATNSEAVRIKMSVTNKASTTDVRTFYDTIVLRESYDAQ